MTDGRKHVSLAGVAVDAKGIRCKRCGCGHHHVIYTRHMAGDRIERRRECRHCGLRHTTVEVELAKGPPRK